MRQGNQTIQAVLTLAGPQDVDVVAHRPGTDGAAIGLRVGGALLHLTDAATVTAFLTAWRSVSANGRDLPVRTDPTRLAPMNGTARPSVFMEAGDRPPALARLERGRPGQPARMWVMLGRMTFDVRDQEALVTTTTAFARAARIAPGVFPPTPDQRSVERAAARASRLLAPPRRRSGRPIEGNRTPDPPGALSPAAPRHTSTQAAAGLRR